MGDDSINVRVTATTDGVEDGMKRAADSVNRFGDAVGSAGPKVTAAAQGYNQDLLNALNSVDAPLSNVSTKMVEATEQAQRFALGSSGATRELVVLGREAASGNFNRLPGSISVLLSRMGLLTPAVFAGIAAIAGLGYAFVETAVSEERFSEETGRLSAVLESLGKDSDLSGGQIPQLIDQLRTLPGVGRDAATQIIEDFASVRDLGGESLIRATSMVGDFARLTGKDAPEAAQELAKALEDPARAAKDWDGTLIALTASESQAIGNAKALGDTVQEQRILMDALSRSLVDVRNNLTPFQQQMDRARQAWVDLDGPTRVGVANQSQFNRGLTQTASAWADVLTVMQKVRESDTPFRNTITALMGSRDFSDLARDPSFGGKADRGGGNATANDISMRPTRGTSSGQDQKADETKSIKEANELYERGNSPLREKEEHLQRLHVLQDGLNAAVDQGDGAAAQQIQAQIDQEDKLYAARMKREQPKVDNTDNEFAKLISEESEKAERDEQKYADTSIETAAKVSEAKIKTAEDAAKEQQQLGQITTQQELASLMDLATQQNSIEMAKFDQLAILYKNDLDKFTEIQAQKAEQSQKFAQVMMALQAKANEDQQRLDQQNQQQFDQSAQKMLGPWESALTRMTTSTRDWQQQVNQAGMSVANQFVGTFVRNMVNSWVLGETTKTSSTIAGNAVRTASNQSADASSASSAASSLKGTVLNHAYSAAAATFDSVAQIPYVGYILAPAAAAVSFAAVAGFGTDINAFAGGGIIAQDQLAMVHQNEMVLPARYTTGLTKMIDGANAGGGSGSGHVFNTTVHANGRLNANDLDGLHDAVVSTMKKAARNGQFGGMRSA